MSTLEEKKRELESEIDTERKRLSADRMDVSFGEILNMYRSDELIIRPEYQRLYRWNDSQKTALIESLLLSIPIPPIFVAEDDDGVWEVVDGLQRISTFISFFGELKHNFSTIKHNQAEEIDEEVYVNEELDLEGYNTENGNGWTLQAGSIIENLEGFNINNLPTSFKINLKRAVCRVEILRGHSNIEMKYELFKRLNSGGSKLTPQEIRNAIYRGTDARLNELLLRLSQNSIFKSTTTLSKKQKEELYDQELVLRFLAFFNKADSINENTENYLNKFMEQTVKDKDYDYGSIEAIFVETLDLLNRLLSDPEQVFRSDRNRFVPAFFEGIVIGLAQNIERYRDNAELLESKVRLLKTDNDFRAYSGSASNSRSRIKKRLTRANEIFLNDD
ncbi:MAG: DUF262 domain-containing protein [Psychrobacter nivimaris]